MALDLKFFQEKLEREKVLLEEELENLGRRQPFVPDAWEAVPGQPADGDTRDEVAERFEEWSERQAAEGPLEHQLRDVKRALEKITSGRYGLCEVGGEPIEEGRLRANPAARTCLKHKNEEL